MARLVEGISFQPRVIRTDEGARVVSVVEQQLRMEVVELAQVFINRWFTPELIEAYFLDENFLAELGTILKQLGNFFPKSSHIKDWVLSSWQDTQSLLKLSDYPFSEELNLRKPVNQDYLEFIKNQSQAGKPSSFKAIWQQVQQKIDREMLLIPVESVVVLRQYDYLVTTPLKQTQAHAEEARELRQLSEEKGEIGYYWRDFYPAPEHLRIGSKVFYVDQRAIRGFGVVSHIDVSNNIQISADTWRWIEPISCDYSLIKPPQRHAQAVKHQYFKGISNVLIIGGWLDPMP